MNGIKIKHGKSGIKIFSTTRAHNLVTKRKHNPALIENLPVLNTYKHFGILIEKNGNIANHLKETKRNYLNIIGLHNRHPQMLMEFTRD